MSIQSTQHITRETAIGRIQEITKLIEKNRYRDIEEKSFESEYDLQQFVIDFVPTQLDNIDIWTDTMLENLMDSPFFRFSMFDNYSIRSRIGD